MEKDKINSVVTTSEDKPEVVDVLLISMIPIVKGGAIWKQIKRCFPSIGIISLAAYAREKGYNPLVIDGSLENYGSNEVILLLRDMCSRYDIRYFGFSSITHAYYETQKVIKFCKENYPNIKINAIVRGYPIYNDATIQDAISVGLTDFVDVCDNGFDAPGTVLTHINKKSRDLIDNADLIISKGMGNFETLYGCKKNIYYSFLCKCVYFTKRFGMKQFESVFKNESDIEL